jgi:hypothetical protein
LTVYKKKNYNLNILNKKKKSIWVKYFVFNNFINDSKHTIAKVSRANINVRYKRTRGDKSCSKGWKFTQFFVVG